MRTTLPCFVRYHILVIGHLWQHHWMMIWLWSAIGAVGGACWWIQVRRGDANFLFSYGWAFVPRLVDWWFCCGDGLGVEDFGCHSWLQVDVWEASQSNYCLSLDEGWHFEEDNECFSRCRCCCQVLLGIYSPCARVLFSSLDVCSHFSPVVAWSCCQPCWPIKRWKCQLRSLAQAQSGISECFFSRLTVWLITLCVVFFPVQYVLRRPARGALAAHSRSFEMARCAVLTLFCSVLCSIVEWVAWVCLCW